MSLPSSFHAVKRLQPFVRVAYRHLHQDGSQNPASDLNDDENAPNTAAQQLEQPSDSSLKRPMSVAERDAATMNAWKEREGSLANAEFEDGSVEGGYRKNVKAKIFRYI